MADWRHSAACLDEDPELFFPIGNTGPAILQIEEAKAVCRRCDVVGTCLRWALETCQDAGVWGGLSEDERRARKRRGRRERKRQTYGRPAVGGQPIPLAPLRAALEESGFDAPTLNAFANTVAETVDPSTIRDILNGRRSSAYKVTYDRVETLLTRAKAAHAAVTA